MNTSLSGLALLLLAVPSIGGEIHVPGDYPTLELAVAAALPGDVILADIPSPVPGPIVIDKPLTIVGAPLMWVNDNCFSGAGAFHLAGGGAGRVVIANAKTRSPDCPQARGIVTGGGFEELHLIQADAEVFTGFTGYGQAAPAVDVDNVPHVIVEDSSLRGGTDDSDHCTAFAFQSYPAVDAPNSVVTVVDSTLIGGGDATFFCGYVFAPIVTCPPSFSGGEGAPAVVADQLLVDGLTSLQGGVGSTFFVTDGLVTTVTCGQAADGPAYVANSFHPFPGTLQAPGTVGVGDTLNLDYSVTGPAAVLAFSWGPLEALPVPGFGYLYLANPQVFGAVPAGASQTLAIPIPDVSLWIGLGIGFQILDATDGLTGPRVTYLLP